MEKQAGFKNCVFVDSNPKNIDENASEFEKTLILQYISDLKKSDPSRFKLKFLGLKTEIKVVNSNFFYNSYSITYDIEKYLLKISLDPGHKRLETEKQALESVNSLVCPEIIDYTLDKNNDIEFLLTSWENGENFENLGIDDFIYNLGTFSAVLDTIHESDTKNIASFESKFEENESISLIEEKLTQKELDLFESLSGLRFNKLNDLFLLIREKFLIKYKEDIPVLCHSNLKFSNILYQSEYIKVINFENSHVSDIYYSLLKVINNTQLYYSDKKVYQFLCKYHENSRILGDLDLETFIQNFESKKELNRMLLLQDLVCKTVFHFFSYGAFSKKKLLSHYLYLYLNIKPTVEKFLPEYIEFFDKLFFTATDSLKTYDIDNINLIHRQP